MPISRLKGGKCPRDGHGVEARRVRAARVCSTTGARRGRAGGMYVTLVAKTHLGATVFANAERAWALWAEMKRGARGTLAACVMPNHVHEVVVTDDPEAARRSLATRVANYARKGAGATCGSRCRPQQCSRRAASAASDPLRPPESVSGRAGARPAVVAMEHASWRARRRARAVGRRRADGGGLRPQLRRIHGVVPSLRLQRSARSGRRYAHAVIVGVSRHRRCPPRIGSVGCPRGDAARLAAHLRRRLTVALARDQGWRDARLIASALRITDRHVRRLALSPEPELLRLGRLFLGDSRLRFVPWAGRSECP